MEIINTKIRENGFKVTPEWLEEVGYSLETWQSILESLELEKAADKEADMIMKSKDDLFFSKPVKYVVRELQRRYDRHDNILLNRVFSYGYILGKRAERARRKKSEQS